MKNTQYLKLKVQKGFTLVETMIAVFIIAVGFLAVLVVFPLGIQIVRSSEMTSIATYLGEAKIEEIISKPYTDISSESKKTLASPFEAFSRETAVTCFDPNGDGVSPDCPDTGIKEIKVTVSWGTPSKEIELLALIAKK